MKPHDIVMALTAAVAFGVLSGALLAEAVRKPAPSTRIYRAPDCRPVMEIPVEWDAVVTQSGPGTEPKTRYYKARR